MSKSKSKDWVLIATSILAIVILPLVINFYFEDAKRNAFYQYVKEDYETCVERAKEDSLDDYWCNEIRSSSKLAFQSASSNASDNFMIILPIQIILIIVLFELRDIRKKVREK